MILASGPSTPNADQHIFGYLSDYVHEILELQRIDLAGRTIIAIHIAFDPAHYSAISADLESRGRMNNLDVAMELL